MTYKSTLFLNRNIFGKQIFVTKNINRITNNVLIPIREFSYWTWMNLIIKLNETSLNILNVSEIYSFIKIIYVYENNLHLPGRSGMITETKTSRCSPRSARSATNLKRSKFIFAPDVMATNVPFFMLFSAIYFLTPATPSAPAGSTIDRVSIRIKP
jgi:hypothetical protein